MNDDNDRTGFLIQDRIHDLSTKLAEFESLNQTRRIGMVNLHELVESLEARLAEAERTITNAHQRIGDLAASNFIATPKGDAAFIAVADAWDDLEGYRRKHLTTPVSASGVAYPDPPPDPQPGEYEQGTVPHGAERIRD